MQLIITSPYPHNAQLCLQYTIHYEKLLYHILLYAPGELQMEPETKGCLYPCGGAI
jgi:hypothetical protein